jgi:hypothetical protein
MKIKAVNEKKTVCRKTTDNLVCLVCSDGLPHAAKHEKIIKYNSIILKIKILSSVISEMDKK